MSAKSIRMGLHFVHRVRMVDTIKWTNNWFSIYHGAWLSEFDFVHLA